MQSAIPIHTLLALLLRGYPPRPNPRRTPRLFANLNNHHRPSKLAADMVLLARRQAGVDEVFPNLAQSICSKGTYRDHHPELARDVLDNDGGYVEGIHASVLCV